MLSFVPTSSDRSTHLHASDMAAVLGVDPYKTAAELALEKLEHKGLREKKLNDSMRLGIHFEEAIGELYSAETGKVIEATGLTYSCQQEGYDFLVGTPDFLVSCELAAMDAKHVGSRMAHHWGRDGDKIAPYMLPQMHSYNLILDLDYCDVAAIIGGYGPFLFHVERSSAWDDLLLEHAQRFWDLIKRGEIPDINVDHPTSLDLLKKIYPGTNGRTIDLPDKLIDIVAERARAKKYITELEKHVKSCDTIIAESMADSAVGKLSNGTIITRSQVSRKGYAVDPKSFIQTTIRVPK